MLNITKNKTLHNVGIVTLGNIANAALGFVTMIMVSRNLGPAQFGVFSVVLGFFTMFSKGGDLGTNSTLIRYLPLYRAQGDKKSEREFIGLILALTYSLIILGFLLVAPFYKQISTLLNVSEYSQFILFAIFASFFVVMFNTYNVILQSLERFTLYLASYSLTSVFKFLLILFLVYGVGISVNSSLYTYLLVPVIGYICSGFFSKSLLKKIPKPSFNKQAFAKASPFIYFMALASVFGALHEQSGVFMSSIVFNNYETGLFSAATKISIIFSLIAGSVGTVVIPKAAKYTDITNIKAFSKKIITLGLFLSMFIFPVILFPKVFIYFTSGDQYLNAAPYLIVLSIAGGFTVFRSTFSSLFYSLNKASYFAILGAVDVFFEIPLLYFLAKNMGVIGIAYGKLITGIILTMFSVIYYLKSVKHAEKK